MVMTGRVEKSVERVDVDTNERNVFFGISLSYNNNTCSMHLYLITHFLIHMLIQAMTHTHTHNRRFLSIVLNAVRGRELIVELKNNTQFRGVVDICENSMNVVMRDVIRRKPTPLSMVMNLPVPETREEMVYIPSKRIRYVHLPQDFQGSKKEVAKFYELLRFCRKAYQAQSRK